MFGKPLSIYLKRYYVENPLFIYFFWYWRNCQSKLLICYVDKTFSYSDCPSKKRHPILFYQNARTSVELNDEFLQNSKL